MSIEAALKAFVQSSQPGSIVLQGKWGLGKTYFWQRKIIDQFLTASHRYSYVSLYGIDSLAELQVALFQASVSGSASTEPAVGSKRSWRPKWFPRGKEAAAIAVDVLDTSYTSGLSKAYNALSFFAVREQLICIDDIERRGTGLALNDVLGLITQLVDQRRCRVVVILNTDALEADDKATWETQKEKVFIGELTFSPTAPQCIDLALEDVADQPWAITARERLMFLQVSNIRILQRVKRYIQMTLDSVDGRELSESTIAEIAKVLVLLVYCHSGRSDDGPPLSFLMKSTTLDYALSMVDEEVADADPKRIAWMKLISDYGVHLGDDLDHALYRLVIAGYPDPSDLAQAITKFETFATEHANRDAGHIPWRLYHDHFDDNQAEIVSAFKRYWPPISSIDHAYNLQSMVMLLRLMGEHELASKYINEWVEQRRGVRRREFEPEDFLSFGPLKDAELVGAIERAAIQARPQLTLEESLEEIATYPRNADAFANIAATPQEEIVNYLDHHPGPKLFDLVKTLVNLNAVTQSEVDSRALMRAALTTIAGRSPLSAHRMKHRFGIELPD